MLAATLLALAAAVLHPAWNLAVKVADDRAVALWGQFLVGGVISLVGLAVLGGVPAAAWPWAVLSAGVHVPYVVLLAAAYEHGDLSLTYPLARGGGALLAGIGGAVLLGDQLSLAGWIALVVMAVGLASFVRPGASRHAIAAALLLAGVIGTYTVVDAHGARIADTPAYVFAVVAAAAVTVSAHGLLTRRGPALRAAVRRDARTFLLTGAGLVLVYGLVLAAMRFAPVGYVAALRECSIVVAALAGWRLLREPYGIGRVASSLVVVGGLVLLVAAR